jgi:catalase
VEKAHIVRAFRFELTRVQTPAIRQRMVSVLRNVAQELAEAVALGLGIDLPPAQPRALQTKVVPEVESSPALSLFARPGERTIRTRRVAILVADGVNGESARAIHAGLAREEAVPRFVGLRLGRVQSTDGNQIEVDATAEAMPSVLFDAVVVPGGHEDMVKVFANAGPVLEFIGQQYRHCKPILVLGNGRAVAERAGVKLVLPSGELDSGVLYFQDDNFGEVLPQFVEAIAAHRHFARETDPPQV